MKSKLEVQLPRHSVIDVQGSEIAMTHRFFSRALPTPILKRCALSVALMLLLASPSLQAQTSAMPSAPTLDQRFESALVHYERNQWPQAYAALVQLAEFGHPEAARMALAMWRFGPKLFSQDFFATTQQLELWSRVWGCGGDNTGLECRVAQRSP